MTEAIIQDLQRSLDTMTAYRDKWREIAWSFAKAQAREFDGDPEQIIEDEWRWLEKQREMDAIQ